MRALQYSEHLIHILEWMLTFDESHRPSFVALYHKLSELFKQNKFAYMKDISIERRDELAPQNEAIHASPVEEKNS